MATRIVGKYGMSSDVAEELGLPRSTVEAVIETYQRHILDNLQRGRIVRINTLGTFKIVETPATRRRNPFNGRMLNVPARQRIKFKTSSSMFEGDECEQE